MNVKPAIADNIFLRIARKSTKFKVTIALTLGAFTVLPLCKSTNALHTIPKEERESLEWFFRAFHQSSSYVLFGTKPMAFLCVQREEFSKSQICQVYNFIDSIYKYYIGNFVELKGWEAWKKYKHLFPSSNFIFFENHDPRKITIFLINKREFLKKVEENIDLFRAVLGYRVTSQKILEACLSSTNLIRETLKDNDALLGILLGFGRHNAQLFSRRHQIENQTSMKPSNGFISLEQEHIYINTKLQSFNEFESDDCNQFNLKLPCFIADLEHPETKKLKIAYKKQYKEIIKKYKGNDFLETTLRQFCNG